MRRELTEEEHKKIIGAIFAGDRIEATSYYISSTESGLTEAQTFIKALTAEMKSTQREKHTAKPQKRRNIWQRLIFDVNE